MELKQYRNNEFIPMTRRYPKLVQKVLIRDSKIAAKVIQAWDIEHNSEKVLEIFLKENKNLSDERYWEMLRTVWIFCGKVENANLFRQLMKSNRSARYYFSTPEEQKKFRELSDEFKIYRATNDKNDDGLSWTTDLEYAQKYANMFDKKFIIIKSIQKNKVFAFIERNNESEIIIL